MYNYYTPNSYSYIFTDIKCGVWGHEPKYNARLYSSGRTMKMLIFGMFCRLLTSLYALWSHQMHRNRLSVSWSQLELIMSLQFLTLKRTHSMIIYSPITWDATTFNIVEFLKRNAVSTPSIVKKKAVEHAVLVSFPISTTSGLDSKSTTT